MKPTVFIGASTSSSSSSRGNKDTIRNLMGFLRLQARLEANTPTFSKLLGLSVSPTEEVDAGKTCSDKDAIVQEDRFSFSDQSNIVNGQHHHQHQQSLVFRYRFPPNERFKHLDKGHDDEENQTIQNRILRSARHRGGCSLSTYTSILDEVTTMAIISATAPTGYPRFGVSVTMQSQWGPGVPNTTGSRDNRVLPKEVDIITTITKLGRTLGFVRAEVRDPSHNNSLICYFDHVKYLPTGWMMGILLTPVGMWCLNLYLQYRYVVPFVNKESRSNNNRCEEGVIEQKQNYDGIMDSFRETSDTTATFQFGPQHSNGMGGLHGGVQAILMERVGRMVAQNEFRKIVIDSNSNSSTNSSNSNSSSIHDIIECECERLQVSYQSSASKFLELRAHVIDPPQRLDHRRDSVTLRVEIVRGPQKSRDENNNNDTGNPKQSKCHGFVVVSEGILTFINTTSSKAKDI